MIKLILLASLVATTSLYAQEKPTAGTPALIEREVKEDKDFNPRKGHFISGFSFEGMKYDVPFKFEGQKQNFSPKGLELWGGRILIGSEIYLGGGFNTTTKLEGYYLGTLFARAQEYKDIKFDFRKTTGQVYGIDLSQAIGYLFDMKTKNPILDEWAYLTVEPFIEAGIGKAYAYSRLNYSYQTNISESYKHRINDDLVNARIGGGVNFTSNEGYFFFLKATVNKYDILKRKSEISSSQASLNTSGTEKNVKIDPVTIFAIGGGYKF